MKKAAFLLLFLCLSNSYALPLSAETENWCGKYFEQDGRGYIQLARNDFGIGSSDCSISGYSGFRYKNKAGLVKLFSSIKLADRLHQNKTAPVVRCTGQKPYF